MSRGKALKRLTKGYNKKSRQTRKKNDPIVGYKRTYQIPETGHEITVVQKKHRTLSAILSDGVRFEKTAEEFNKGEFVAALLNFIQAPLEELESILDQSETYFDAKNAVCIINKANVAIPQVRYFLIQGLLKVNKVYKHITSPNLDKILLKEDELDFSKDEYIAMRDYLHHFLRQRCKAADMDCVSQYTVRYRYLSGDGLFPEEWDYFQFFNELNPEFEVFTQGWSRKTEQRDNQTIITTTFKPESKAFYYDVYVQKRRKLRKRLEDINTQTKNIPPDDRPILIKRILKRPIQGATDITPELQLLFENWDGKVSQQVAALLTYNKPLTQSQFEKERKRELDRGRKSIRIIEDKAPPSPLYIQFEEFPLCCVNTLLSGMFKYSLLKYFSDEFDKRGIPHNWVTELEAEILYNDGIVNPYTTNFHDQIERGRDYAEGSVFGAGAGLPRIMKKFELSELAEKAKRDIAFGKFGTYPIFNLQHGDFITFYNAHKRVTNTLPDKYWELAKLSQLFCRAVTMTMGSLPWDREPGQTEPTPEEIQKHLSLVREQREQNVNNALSRIQDLMDKMPKIMKRIYGTKKHTDHVLPWNFMLEPYLLGLDALEAENLDVISTIEKPQYSIAVVNNPKLWEKHDVVPFSKTEVTDILTKLNIPESLAKLVHSNNFIKPTSIYLPPPTFPARIIFTTDFDSMLTGGNIVYAR
jgi:hypothetical protein